MTDRESDYKKLSADEVAALAAERGIGKVKGSGAGGNVLKRDLVKALEKLDRKEAKAAEPSFPPQDDVPPLHAPLPADPNDEVDFVVGAKPEVEAPKPAPTVDDKRKEAIGRLHRAVFGDDSERPEPELLTKAADLIDYLRRRK